MTLDPMTFMQSLTGYAKTQETGSQSRPIVLATIDPAYDTGSFPDPLPKVTFDGEDTMSGKRYAVMSPYWPQPGDRVAMVPIGTTYLIIGTVKSGVLRTTTGMTVPSGFTTNSFRGNKISGVVSVYLYIHTNNPIAVAGNNITPDLHIATLPAKWWPPEVTTIAWDNGTVGGVGLINTNGAVYLRTSSGNIGDETNIRTSATFVQG